MHFFTTEQKGFVRENLKGRKYTDLLPMFNECFGTDIKINQLRAFIKNNGFASGLVTRFKPSHVPFNKGKKGMGGWEPTQFKKGHRPQNYMPVGSERVNGDDYVDIKIADPNKWRGKHILVWEEHYGTLPKNNAVIFGNGDRRNFDPDNLICVSRAQLAVLNKHKLIQDDADLTRTAIIIADINLKIGSRKRT